MVFFSFQISWVSSIDGLFTKNILEIWDVERLKCIFNDWQFAIKNIKYQMSNFITFRIWKRYKNERLKNCMYERYLTYIIIVATLRILKNHKFEQVGNSGVFCNMIRIKITTYQPRYILCMKMFIWAICNINSIISYDI